MTTRKALRGPGRPRIPQKAAAPGSWHISGTSHSIRCVPKSTLTTVLLHHAVAQPPRRIGSTTTDSLRSLGPGRTMAAASNTAARAAEGFESCPGPSESERVLAMATGSGHSRKLALDLAVDGALKAHQQLLVQHSRRLLPRSCTSTSTLMTSHSRFPAGLGNSSPLKLSKGGPAKKTYQVARVMTAMYTLIMTIRSSAVIPTTLADVVLCLGAHTA